MKHRPAPHPGPRCATHWREEQKRRKAAAHERKVTATYDLGPGGYAVLYATQGGVCAICRRATGRARRLAVDHDHRTGVVRGLLCSPCNTMLGHGRDQVAFFLRAVDYLQSQLAECPEHLMLFVECGCTRREENSEVES
jgi:hypothetical protein